ncbi:YitT family protein, partial [Hallella bergensis]
MTSENKKIINEIRDYVMIGIAMISYSIGWNIFLLPNSIGTGGVAGIASIVFWAADVPVQFTYFLVNAVLLLIALRILGFKFCIKTMFGVAVLTTVTALMQEYSANTHLLSNEPFMASIIGGIFCGSGVGIGLAFRG